MKVSILRSMEACKWDKLRKKSVEEDVNVKKVCRNEQDVLFKEHTQLKDDVLIQQTKSIYIEKMSTFCGT